MAILPYYPEMGEQKPPAQGEVRLSHRGGWLLKTPLTFKGRGIKYERTFTSADLMPQAQHKVGWHEYYLTKRAFKMLDEKYTFSSECLL